MSSFINMLAAVTLGIWIYDRFIRNKNDKK